MSLWSRFKGLEKRYCGCCGSVTLQRPILVRVGRPSKRWEWMFTVCLGCLQQGHDPVGSTFDDVYFRTSESSPETPFQRAVYSAIRSGEGETLWSISRRLEQNGAGMMHDEVKIFLDSLVQEGFIYSRRMDYTARLVKELRTINNGRHGRRCSVCRGTLIPLYAPSSDNSHPRREKVGTYCIRCRQKSLDEHCLTRLFVSASLPSERFLAA
jgi:hypothetical protein